MARRQAPDFVGTDEPSSPCGHPVAVACGKGSNQPPPANTKLEERSAPSERARGPESPYDYRTWTKRLDDVRESERAVTELEQLGNPAAIPALGKTWHDQGRPVRVLQVIISLARPLTPEEAQARFVTDYEKTGRPASWDAALPFLTVAVTEVDDANPRSIDSATKAEGKTSLGELNVETAILRNYFAWAGGAAP